MSADVLRRAAALMRERAEAASGGVWSLDGPYWWNGEPPDSSDMVTAGAIRLPVAIMPQGKPRQRTRDATHIASWHPAVALAVADWLDVTAALSGMPGLALNPDGDPYVDGWRSALAVARAYLGES